MEDPPDVGVFVARGLLDGTEPLLGVRHHDDGDWVFWGRTEPTNENAVDVLVLVHFAHVVQRFPGVSQLARLPRDRAATRSSPAAPFLETGRIAKCPCGALLSAGTRHAERSVRGYRTRSGSCSS